MTYTIEMRGVTYEVEPYVDDGDLFAVIRSVSGLEAYGSDELSELFSEDVQIELARELARIMKKEWEEV